MTKVGKVTNVSTHGFWLMLGAEELFVPFSEFPWFKDAPIAKLTHVERPQPHHLYRSEERRVGKECRSRWSPSFRATPLSSTSNPMRRYAAIPAARSATPMVTWSMRVRMAAFEAKREWPGAQIPGFATSGNLSGWRMDSTARSTSRSGQ